MLELTKNEESAEQRDLNALRYRVLRLLISAGPEDQQKIRALMDPMFNPLGEITPALVDAVTDVGMTIITFK